MNTRMVDSIHESLISDALPFSDAILLVAKEGPTGLRLTRMVTTYPSCFLLPRENINTELRLWACLSTNVPFCTQILTRFRDHTSLLSMSSEHGQFSYAKNGAKITYQK